MIAGRPRLEAGLAADRTPPVAVADATPLWPLIAASVVWQVGAHVDAWYHAHWGFAVESFFTWPHALLYAGWLAVGLSALASTLRPGAAPPLGHRLALAGAALFGLGGVLDYGWHRAFGFETGLSSLLSPSHVWLMVSGLITALGVLLAAAERRHRRGLDGRSTWRDDLAVTLAVALLFRLSRYILFYSEPLSVDYATGGAIAGRLPSAELMGWRTGSAQVAGTTGIVLYSVLLALFVVLAVRSLRLPAGGVALVLLWDGLLTAAVDDMWRYVQAVVVGGLTAELLWAGVRRGLLGGPSASTGYWVLGALVPTAQFCAYFALAAALDGIVWPIHLWMGSPIVAGLYGLIAVMLAVPPRTLRAD